MKRTSTITILIVSFVLTLAASGAYAFLFLAMKKSNDRISEYKSQLSQNEERNIQEKALKNLVEDITPQLEKLDSFYIPSDGSVSFFGMVEELGKDAGVTVVINTVNDPTKEGTDPIGILTLNLTFTGSWKNSIHFVSLLEKLPYDVKVSNLTLKADLNIPETPATPAASTTAKDAVKPATPVGAWQGVASIDILKLK